MKGSNKSYYRALSKFKGNNVVFKPKGYHEATDEDGNPIMHTGDVWARSEKPEIAASKIIGGAILGLWSMGNNVGKLIDNAYVYEIKESPQKDLSHIRRDDFEWLKEVRYTKPVKGKFVGKFSYSEQFDKSAMNFYDRLNEDPWDDSDVDIEDWDKFEKFILSMGKNDLK